ncbi:hypothetical protein V5O48_006028 [Marasmius crinis-equi]|uniref:Uncharacterized protein n=1 Tax=Marasmius crinis-equi TaxID=585013 RepID=A0ABR3FL50_9AGAR
MKKAQKTAAEGDGEEGILNYQTLQEGLKCSPLFHSRGTSVTSAAEPVYLITKDITNKRNSILDDVGDYGGWGESEKANAAAFTRHMPMKEMRESSDLGTNAIVPSSIRNV